MTMMESNSSMNPLHVFFDIESMSHHVYGRSDSHGKKTLTRLSSFPPMATLSYLVSCCKINQLHASRIYPLKYDQNYLGGSSTGLPRAFWMTNHKFGYLQISRR
uniref:Uncharacterized protein n=1 Tax=Nicotiana tabacum TaxID=4097 RepID=A0A1S4D8J7_TOBAC|nr:PREDICTED: uncharacterized protein LOC107827138 [Nicotiana tabacum]